MHRAIPIRRRCCQRCQALIRRDGGSAFCWLAIRPVPLRHRPDAYSARDARSLLPHVPRPCPRLPMVSRVFVRIPTLSNSNSYRRPPSARHGPCLSRLVPAIRSDTPQRQVARRGSGQGNRLNCVGVRSVRFTPWTAQQARSLNHRCTRMHIDSFKANVSKWANLVSVEWNYQCASVVEDSFIVPAVAGDASPSGQWLGGR